MTHFVALLRAVNVGGTGMLPMSELRALCVALGWQDVRTYIQSGNVVFRSEHQEPTLRRTLEGALTAKLGKPVGVAIRTGTALRATLDANPFPAGNPAQVTVVFLPDAAPPDLLTGLVIPGREEIRLIGREVFVHYPDGIGRSKLKLPPPAAAGTARNLNTVARLADMAGTS
jgi:uncharacterized protein (DUF1697 family)